VQFVQFHGAFCVRSVSGVGVSFVVHLGRLEVFVFVVGGMRKQSGRRRRGSVAFLCWATVRTLVDNAISARYITTTTTTTTKVLGPYQRATTITTSRLMLTGEAGSSSGR
jgi:hypothetical protein